MSWSISYLPDLQPTYIGVIIRLLSTMDITVGFYNPIYLRPSTKQLIRGRQGQKKPRNDRLHCRLGAPTSDLLTKLAVFACCFFLLRFCVVFLSLDGGSTLSHIYACKPIPTKVLALSSFLWNDIALETRFGLRENKHKTQSSSSQNPT